MSDPIIRVSAQITHLLSRMSAAWATHDFDVLREIWSLAPEPLVYLAEEADFARSRQELDEYWARTSAGIHEVRASYSLLSVAPLTGTTYVATFMNDWAARERPGEEMIAGTCRGVLIVEEIADGILPRIYIEAPSAPLLYVRDLYKLVARTRGFT